MNHDTSNCPRNLLIATLALIFSTGLLVIGLMAWKSHQTKNDKLDRLEAQNRKLEQDLNAAILEIRMMNSGDSSETARQNLDTARQVRTPVPAEPEIETLILQTPSVQETPDGLQARLVFETGEEHTLPEDLTLVVRVPSSSTARILSFSPESVPDGARVDVILNTTGKLAYIQCTPADLDALAFLLKVTEPITATVRGSEGIHDFEVDIAPGESTFRKL